MTSDQLLSGYDYTLPSELIAQNPVTPRDHSRLLVIDSLNTHVHSFFYQLTEWLQPGDLLVLNNTQVIPARLYGRKATGAPIEVLLLEEKTNNCWLALVKPGKRFKLGSEIWFYPFNAQDIHSNILKAKVIERDAATGGRLLEFEVPEGQSFLQILEQFGQIPFPPYVNDSEALPSQYQTVYAHEPGSVAAPTAGLHFTEELIGRLKAMGVKIAYVTLHVGVGTFRPVEVEDITQHIMHQEWIELPQTTVDLIKETKAKGARVIAVGTTAIRTLEGAMKEIKVSGRDDLAAFCGQTNLFIYPDYRWQVIDGLITNFHLPKSSLLMLVSALIGRERLLTLYAEAIKEKYRFYSFGDAMLILPSAVI